MTFILDGSAALAWCFHDEWTPAILALMARVTEEGALVPNLWRLEVANALLSGMRRGRLDPEARDHLMAAFDDAKISVDPDTDRHVWPGTIRLSDRHGLTVYDASYLELAIRMALPLATLDKALARAANAEGVALVECQ